MRSAIPVIDLFAGPGGLGEGFSRLTVQGERAFGTALSIEKDASAHATLTLRSFYRQFERVPSAYVERVRGAITTRELYELHPREAEVASRESWRAELGSAQTPVSEVRHRVEAALRGADDWVLLGGPPCQAYSLAGRSRNKGVSGYRFEDDKKTTLYLEYLQLIADFWPAVFVMENVKGLLSAKLSGSSMFERIQEDLRDPAKAIRREGRSLRHPRTCHRYDLYPVVASGSLRGGERATDFVVHAEKFGVPQARHRVIIVGVRSGFARRPLEPLGEHGRPVTVAEAIGELPSLRSGLSDRGGDRPERWADAIGRLARQTWQKRIARQCGQEVADVVRRYATRAGEVAASRSRGSESTDHSATLAYRPDWYEAGVLPVVTNHVARTHMASDVQRYAFAACFAQVRGRPPGLADFPSHLLPQHTNVLGGIDAQSHFVDRFRVQMGDRPSTTVTSHISKDGHYYIHPDPEQCRSLTVREAARLQTFPDTYFFEGPRTAQYTQVGNAVPPLLAHQIARRVHELFE